MTAHEALRLIREAVAPDAGRGIRYGVVTDNAPLNVLWDGETSDGAVTYPTVGSYAPTVGDKVMAVRDGATWVVVGAVGTPASGRGTAAGNTDSTGRVTITHGLGFTPSMVFVQNKSTGGSQTSVAGHAVDTFTATTFALRFSGVSATAVYAIDFLAFR